MTLPKAQFIENLHGEAAFQGFAVDQTLHSSDSPYQHIDIFQTAGLGRVLVLDGIVQTTESDEFMYHEMLVHVPMFACEAPRDVLIIGGGDGGSLREVLKHDIERVDMIEIDRQVVDACIEHLPTLNNAGDVYDDPRANLIIEDAFAYLRREQKRYDVIISDSTDPIGAAEVLFSREFYELCEAALKPSGALSLQNGVAFFQPDEPRGTMRELRQLGLLAKCYLVAVPTYYGGSMTLGFASRDKHVFEPTPEQVSQRFKQSGITLRHYTPTHHLASFALPQWIQAITGDCNESST